SEAFAVADHQLAHIYIRDPQRIVEIQQHLESTDGIAQVVPPGELQLDHPRSGELIALSEPDSWFTYYYWKNDEEAPDFARTVDIHRKPGYDPCELFMTSRFKAIARVAQKKLGLRYKMDVIPLDANLPRGSHGIYPTAPQNGPLVIGPEDPPEDMLQFSNYVKRQLAM
ncbi:MAG: alkaline phosphatase family protein, partial [Rubripirellula sp.]|nr:alkaline phosphatase family protein [Rubripirellula sp.]